MDPFYDSVTGSANTCKEVLKTFNIKLQSKTLTFVEDHANTNINAVFSIIAFP